jgi:hypothetical protein
MGISWLFNLRIFISARFFLKLSALILVVSPSLKKVVPGIARTKTLSFISGKMKIYFHS